MTIAIEDEARLKQLGYKQELFRALNSFSNFGIAFTILSEPMSVLPLMYLGLLSGGPQAMLINWPIISVLAACSAASMSEIISSYPTSGGLYYWAASLAGPKLAPFASFMTGYFNSLGLAGLATGTAYAFGQFFANVLVLSGVIEFDTMTSKVITMVAGWVALIMAGILCSMRSKVLNSMGQVSFWFNLLGLAVIVISVVAS
jgi:amino acid transporter